ncbi:hypothetical protein PR003_g15959 [Phytophthora rubi]|uniref:Pectate lyase n=1 Tax=Phytophthora rubi TaxID=129364 RepID=A0A6A4EUG9_9STRA|nr:hypothetical protein PR003_g15959 [Phytophthora rubi]
MSVDDGGIPTTKFVDMPCNQNSVNQVFKDNIKTCEIESVNKPGMRIDDGGASKPAVRGALLCSDAGGEEEDWTHPVRYADDRRSPIY